MIIAAWNIEKCGLSSTRLKRTVLDTFLFECAYAERPQHPYADIIFLSEVHSARVDGFTDWLHAMYGHDFDVDAVDGNYSNNYVFMIKHDVSADESVVRVSNWQAERPMLVLACRLSSGTFYVGFLHAKSGQTGLTKRQLETAMHWLDQHAMGCWLLTGDLNWEFENTDQLSLPPGADRRTCWFGPTQRRGNCLDWALIGSYATVTGRSLSLKHRLPSSVVDMSSMDHKPVVFAVR